MSPIAANDGRIVGIIYPPPEVRNIVDKTASFVARNGPEFEQRIKQNELNNPKFTFLNSGDPYNAYYEHKVEEIREGKDVTPPPAADVPKKALEGPLGEAKIEKVKQRQSDLLKQVQKETEPPPPKDPPPDFEFVADPPSISAFDLDVVKLTAQFVARNGRQFLTNLMNKEQRNYQFDFLRPQHSLFQYFTKLLEQYTKVLIPPKDLLKKLGEEAFNEALVKDQMDYRVRWIKHVEAKKRREEEEAERERVSYAQIDWHNFVVVETVDYQPWEVGNFPPPTNPQEVGARVLMQRRIESAPAPVASSQKAKVDENREGGANTNVEDMEEGSSSEEDEDDEDAVPQPIGKPLMAVDAAPAVQQPPPALPTRENVEVRSYDPKAKKKVVELAEQYLVSPMTGEKLPASKVAEHMRIGLLDPRWVEERDKQITKVATEDQVFAPGQSISHSLKHLAERRTDIFGVGEDAAKEAAIGNKMGEEETMRGREEKVTWDGHSSTAEHAARAARVNISLNDQIEQIHRNKGLIPDSAKESIGPQSSVQVHAPPPPQQMAPPPPVTVVSMQPPQPVPVPQPQPVAIMQMRPPPQMVVPAQQMFMAPAPPHIPSFGMHHMQPHAAPAPPMPQMEMDEPPNKKARGEDNLMPEADFLARNISPVTFRVVMPDMPDKPEWKLHGQTIAVTLPLSDPISALKARLFDETGMQAGKQKLQMENIFFKDTNTLAYYNIYPATVVHLQVKERGGRKK